MKALILAVLLPLVLREGTGQEVLFSSNRIVIPLSEEWVMADSQDEDFKGFVMTRSGYDDAPFLYIVERSVNGTNHSEQLFRYYHQVMQKEKKYKLLNISNRPYGRMEKLDHKRVMATFYEGGKAYIDHTVLVSGGDGSNKGFIIGMRYERERKEEMEPLVTAMFNDLLILNR
jgi:hypothetical protein